MYGWLTFYHQGHEASKDCKPYMTDLQIRVQNVSSLDYHVDFFDCCILLPLQTRENFKSSRDDIQALMRKMLEVRQTVSTEFINDIHILPGKLKAFLVVRCEIFVFYITITSEGKVKLTSC